MAKKFTTHTTNRDESSGPRSLADNELQGAVHGDTARLGDCMIDDIFISDRVVGEVAEYRAAMTAALRRHLLAATSILLNKVAAPFGPSKPKV